MLNVMRRLLSLQGPIYVTPSRGTVIVERWYKVPLAKEGEEPYLHPRRHQIYRVVEDTKHTKKEKMELILTQSIHKLGSRGDTVLVEKAMGRNKLLPQGLAVYPSLENKQMFEEEKKEMSPEERGQTWTGEMTVKYLKNCRLEVRMRVDSGWTLSKENIARSLFRELFVVVPMEALKIPEEPISTFGEYWCEITVNKIDTVRVPMDVVKFDRPRSRRYRMWLARQALQKNKATDSPAEGSDAPDSTEG